MKLNEQLNLGIVGACGRGASFKAACDASEVIRLHAVCDINAEHIDAAAERLGAAEKYTDFETMLAKSELDAVIIGTPMHIHARQTIQALENGLHVLCEVPATVSIDEAKAVVAATKASRAIYMMAENYVYTRASTTVREIADRGLFGTPYFGEGEYLHELKGLNEITTWRRKWQTGINGITYGTHSLGPLLQWMRGDRVSEVACVGSGHHYRDPRGNPYEQEDTCVMLGKMAGGGLVKIRVDMLSDRPHAMHNHTLQGTDGCYESTRGGKENNRIWLRSRCPDAHTWLNLADLEDEFLPDYWRQASESAAKAGHGGGDYFEIMDFLDACLGRRAPSIGIHEAMDMTLPGLVSQDSIRLDGAWLPVPDSRSW